MFGVDDLERLAPFAERLKITAAFIDLGITGPPDDETISRVVVELYRGEATRAQMDAVLDVVDNLGRLYRGEPLRHTDPA